LFPFSNEEKENPEIHAYADYRLDQKSWNGLRRIGCIFCWHKETQNSIVPTSAQISPELQMGAADSDLPSKSCLFGLDWKVDIFERRPSLEFRVVQRRKSRLSCFLPIFNRCDLHLISNLNWLSRDESETDSILHDVVFENDQDRTRDWWIPEIKIDCLSNSVTAENQIAHLHRNRYLSNFRLSVKRAMSFWSDDGNINIRLECGFRDARKSASLLRLEAPFSLSDWFGTICSSRLVLIHERL